MSVPVGVNGDQVLADFQACTGIDDIAVALVHLQESEWDLLRAVNRVIPDNSQALPSERSSGPRFRPFSESVPMDQDASESDVHLMEDDDVIIAPNEVNNGENHTTQAFSSASSSTARNNAGGSEERSRRNDMNHVGTSSGSSDSKMKSERHKSNSIRNHALPPRVTLSADFLEPGAGPSKEMNSERTSNKEIRFVVHYNGETLPMSLAQCETIDTLKTLVHARFEIPPCQQIISGWPTSEPSSNSTRFGSLNLPEEVNLQLTTASSNLAGLNILRTEEEDGRYQLHIRDDTNNEDYNIGFDATRTVRGVKEDFSALSEIPVRLQVWSGWPSAASDGTALSLCGLSRPVHNLNVKRQTTTQNSMDPRRTDTAEVIDGSDASDIEDLTESYPIEEEFFVPERNSSSSVRHLITDNIIDETVGTIQFSENFSGRYGACHPMFFQGSLEDAVKEACQRTAKLRKPLAMYLHHDGSVMSNVFCQQVLCNESVVSYLTNNFVMWGWDVTNESNRQLLIASVNRNFGTNGVSTIRSFDRDKYPVIIVVTRVRSATEICNVLSGSNFATVDELMGTLMHTVEMFQSQQRADVREEEEREAREYVKREQDEAYQASLAADRAKDEAKRMVEQQKKLEEQQKKDDAEREQRERDDVAKGLPTEPGNDCAESVCVLKCRLPGGKIVSRRFLHSSIVKVLCDFLFSQGFSKEKYKFLTTYPKRDLTTMPDSTVMKDVFSAQDTLIVEER